MDSKAQDNLNWNVTGECTHSFHEWLVEGISLVLFHYGSLSPDENNLGYVNQSTSLVEFSWKENLTSIAGANAFSIRAKNRSIDRDWRLFVVSSCP